VAAIASSRPNAKVRGLAGAWYARLVMSIRRTKDAGPSARASGGAGCGLDSICVGLRELRR
jgi:hypothetical protein